MAWCPRRSLALCFAVLAPTWMAGTSHAYDIPNQVMQSFTFELHSVDDDIDLYIGDPQSLFLMYVRPQGSLRPNLEFSNTAQVGLLRVRDLSLFEEPPLPDDLSEEEAEMMEEPEKRVVAQEWRMELAPSAPALVVLHCVRGKARYDFTGIDVREAYLQADTAQVRVDFDRPNRIALERFKMNINGGSLRLRRFLNSRARSTSIAVPDARCELDLTGEATPGLYDVFVEGVPEKLKLTLLRHMALHVDGPSPTVLRFDRDDFERVGTGLQSPGFAESPCRMSLHFSQAIPKLEIEWVE